MRYELRKIGVWPAVRVMFFTSLVLGVLKGFLFAVVGATLISSGNSPAFLEGLGLEGAAAAGLFVTLPIVGAVFGSFVGVILGALWSVLYNVVARWFGGYEIELREVELQPVEEMKTKVDPIPAPNGSFAPPPPPPPVYCPSEQEPSEAETAPPARVDPLDALEDQLTRNDDETPGDSSQDKDWNKHD